MNGSKRLVVAWSICLLSLTSTWAQDSPGTMPADFDSPLLLVSAPTEPRPTAALAATAEAAPTITIVPGESPCPAGAACGTGVGTSNLWSRLLADCHDPCKKPNCAYSHTFMPLELFGRVGGNFIVTGGPLDAKLDHGLSVEVGARNFCYDDDNRAAWRADLGFDYVFNDGKEQQPAGTIRELHQLHFRGAAGREWYWNCEGCKMFSALDLGARVGHVHAKIVDQQRVTDRSIGLFLGTELGFVFPRCGYDLLLGTRTEWGHDWFEVIPGDDNTGHVTVMLEFGVRY